MSRLRSPKVHGPAQAPVSHWFMFPFLESVTIAYVAARMLFPSEDAATGSGLYFLPLAFAAGPVAVWCWRGPVPGREWAFVAGWSILLAAIWTSAAFASYRYSAVVMAWEWTAAAIATLSVYRLTSRRGPAPVCALIVAAVLGQSLVACWQVAIEFPDLRRRYERHDPEITRQMAELGIERGTASEQQFRDRLYATEPYGAFGHPNTLAGLLLLGLPILVVAATERWNPPTSGPRKHVAGRVILAALVLLTFTALLLTKSRSAWIAALVTVASLPFQRGNVRQWIRRHFVGLSVAAVAIAAIAISLSFAGIIDRLVFTEAFKSFQYRYEWWQGSLAVIREYPLLGVGFGNFASEYLRHKLPFSSEEIQDPHNFLIELWSCAGIFAAASYLMLLGLVASGRSEYADSQVKTNFRLGGAWWFGLLAAVDALIAVGPMGGSAPWQSILGFGLASALLAVAGRSSLHLSDDSLRQAAFTGAVAVHIHWLAAGGVSYSAVLLPTWALLAAAFARSDPVDADQRAGRGWVKELLLAGMTVPFLMFMATVYWPIIQRDQIQRDVRRIPQSSAMVRLYERAAQAVPGDESGWIRLAMLRTAYCRQIRAAPVAGMEYQAAEQAWQKAIALNPRRSANYRSLAQLYNEAARRGFDEQASAKAAEAFRRVIELYPNSAVRRYELGEALLRIGRSDQAIDELRQALYLDQTPHPDKRLTKEQRQLAHSVVGSQ